MAVSYLQIYLDTDYILPIAVGGDGNVVKYKNQQGDSRLWLYFSKATGGAAYETGVAQKANFEAHLDGHLGDFWKHLEAGDPVPGEPFGYVDLLEVANVLTALREWAGVILGTETPSVVLNFATTIGVKARRVLVDYLQRKGFLVRSYSVELSDLLAAKIVYDHPTTMQRTFGDQLLIMQGTGRTILLSTMTWCGDCFMQGDRPTEISRQGDEFKKQALATMVVDKMEQKNNMLNPEEVPGEIAYQTQFAERWLAGREGDTIWAEGFHYSYNPSKIYPPIPIDARQLDLVVADNIRETERLVTKFYRENIKGNHLHTIMVGDVFRDELFCSHCVDVTNSKDKCTFFNDNAVQEAMGRYFYVYADLTEAVDELERRYLTQENERERIRKYVKNAELLGLLRDSIKASALQMEAAIAGVKARTREVEEAWESNMQKSRFDEAERLLSRMSQSDELLAAQVQVLKAMQQKEANASTLTDLHQLGQPHVQQVLDGIEQGYEQLQQLQVAATNLEKHPNELKERVQHYRDVYSVYLDYKRKLEGEQSLGGKRRVLAEMKDKDLTMEPLPKVDVETVTAKLTCDIEVQKSGFLGMKKQKFLHVAMQMEGGAELPFPCVLQITDRNQIEVNRRGWYADLDEGVNNWEKTIPFEELPVSERGVLVVQLLPDEAHAYLTSAVYCESKRITIK